MKSMLENEHSGLQPRENEIKYFLSGACLALAYYFSRRKVNMRMSISLRIKIFKSSGNQIPEHN